MSTKPAKDLQVGDVIDYDVRWHMDNQRCEVREIKHTTSLFGTPQITLSVYAPDIQEAFKIDVPLKSHGLDTTVSYYCCDNEQRNMNGGCTNCGDPCL